MRRPKQLSPTVEGYLEYMEHVKRRAAGTLRDVRCSLGRVSAAMERYRPGVELWKLTLSDYIWWVEELRSTGCPGTCISKYLSHIRGLLEYAWRSGKADRNVLDGFKIRDAVSRTQPRSLSLEEARRLVEACERGSEKARRDRLIILLLYGCGLRTSELCGLRVQDVNQERAEVFVQHGKGDRERTVPVPPAVFTELLAYMLERGGKRGPLFRTFAKKRRLQANDVCDLVKAKAEEAGLGGEVTPKTLRHSYATHLMDRGIDLAVIASLMGHRSPSETGVYLHVLEPRPREAVDKLTKGGGA